MAIQKIQYTNKEQLVNDTTINDKYKCKADDLNEIKEVVNNNADEIPSNDNLVNVGTSVDTNYKTNILSSMNLFDKNNYNYLNAYLTSTGIVSGNGTKTIYIPIKPNTTYTISKTTSTRFRVCTTSELPSTSSVVSDYVSSDNETSITITSRSNAKYLVSFIYNPTTDTLTEQQILDSLQIEKGSTATTYEPFIQNTINVNNEKYTDTINVGTSINDKNRVNVLYSKNLLNINTSVNASFVVNSTSETLDANPQAITSAWIPCKPNTTYTLGGESNRNRWQTKASDGTITYMGESGKTITTNTTAKYIRVYYWYQNGSAIAPNSKNTMLVEGNTAPTDYIPYITPSINIDGNEIYNQNIMNYSTNEINTGMKWIDGKDIYRKAFTFTTNSNIYTYTTDITTSSISDVWINPVSFGKLNSNVLIQQANSTNSNSNYNMGMIIDASQTNIKLLVRNGTERTIINYTIIVEYTKTS